MKRLTGRVCFSLTALSLFLPSLGSAVNIPLTVQEALYTGAPTSGIARSQYPLTVGIPLADSDNISNISQLGLAGASAAQFRALGRWPSGNIEWVLIDTLADVPAGGQSTILTLTNGSGNFGGSNLATDNGANITINTGPAQFNIRKANFNLFDSVVVNGKTIVASGTSEGLVVMGPDPSQAFPANVSCPPQISGAAPCATKFASSNDASSTAVIEENGPVRAVIKADGSHVDATGHTYMHFTVRLFFYKGHTHVKATVILRNADETNTGNDFASAFKGFASYEARVAANLGSSRSFQIGADTTVVSGAFTGSEDAYLYQGFSRNMFDAGWNSTQCSPTRTARCNVAPIARSTTTCSMGSCSYVYAQNGYQAVHGTTVLASGDQTQYPQGWADLSDSSGAGIDVGIYQMSAYWPKSLEFTGGGTQVRVGIWPDQSLFQSGGGIAYYQTWPAYSMIDLFYEFHDSALASPSNDFLSFQHYLVARAPWQQYNTSKALALPLIDPAAETSYYSRLGYKCCDKDVVPLAFRTFGWAEPGAGNQHELRWSNMRNFLERGLTGRYLSASHFYHYMIPEMSFPRSDGFDWRNHPVKQLTPEGFPDPQALTSVNNYLNFHDWIDDEHAHWYGMVDYYYMTGDETAHDQMLDGVKDRYLNTQISYNNGWEWDTRDIGGATMAMARLHRFYNATGDPDAAGIVTVANQVLADQVFPDVAVSSTGFAKKGTSRTRGLHWGCCNGDGESNPPISGRVTSSFHIGILEEGLYELSQELGPSWPNYNLTMDLTYGMAQWSLRESYVVGNPPSASANGWRYMMFLDYANNSPAGCCWWYKSQDNQTNWFHFFITSVYTGDTSWKQDFDWYLQRTMANGDDVEIPSHMVQATMYQVLNPNPLALVNVPVNVTNNGSGSYTLSWKVPNGAQSYRVKTANKKIVDWIGFDPGNNVWIGDPTTTWNWFASTEVVTGASSSCPPPPTAPGTTQSCTVSGLATSQPNYFALKAWATPQPADLNPPARPMGLSLQ